MKKIRCFCTISFLAIILLFLTLTSKSLSIKSPTKIVSVGVLEDLNILMQNKDGTYSGYLDDYFKKITAYVLKQYNINLQFEYILGTPQKLSYLLKNKKVNMITESSENNDNHKFISKTFISTQSVLMTEKNNKDLCFENFEELPYLFLIYIL